MQCSAIVYIFSSHFLLHENIRKVALPDKFFFKENRRKRGRKKLFHLLLLPIHFTPLTQCFYYSEVTERKCGAQHSNAERTGKNNGSSYFNR